MTRHFRKRYCWETNKSPRIPILQNSQHRYSGMFSIIDLYRFFFIIISFNFKLYMYNIGEGYIVHVTVLHVPYYY